MEWALTRLSPEKLHVRYRPGTGPDAPFLPRRYTLTHSDFTGDLFLTIGEDYDRKQISGLYTRLMRDEVLAEWMQEEGRSLHVYVVEGGRMVFGTAAWRGSILRNEMPLVLEAIRQGDERFLAANPDLDSSPIYVHFRSHGKPDKVERWGCLADYRINP